MMCPNDFAPTNSAERRNAGSLEGLYGQAVSVRTEGIMKAGSTTW